MHARWCRVVLLFLCYTVLVEAAINFSVLEKWTLALTLSTPQQINCTKKYPFYVLSKNYLSHLSL